MVSKNDLSSCFFRKPTDRELEFRFFFHTVQLLLASDEASQLRRYHNKGRTGYDLESILGIMLLKLHYRQPTMKETLLLLQENGNLWDILGICQVPSPASASRLSREVERIVQPADLHGRVMRCYASSVERIVGHLSLDSTIIEAREKPVKQNKSQAPKEKKGRKEKGPAEEKEYLERKAMEQQKRLEYLMESPEKSLSELEMRCSVTAKQNSKGKKQWFIGYTAPLTTDDFGVPVAYAVTGAWSMAARLLSRS